MRCSADGRLAHDVKSVGYQGVFQLQDRLRHGQDAGAPLVLFPGGLRRAEVQGGRLGLYQLRESLSLDGLVRGQTAPALDGALEVDQPAVESGPGDRGGQVADQGRGGAALGDRAFRRVVRGIEIEVGQVGDQTVGPTGGGEPGLLARHELQCPMGAEVQHRVGPEVLAQVPIEGAEGVRRGEALLE